MTLHRSLSITLVIFLLGACTSTEPLRRPPSAERSSGEREQIAAPRCRKLDELVLRTRRGYVPVRSAEIQPIPAEPHYVGTAASPVHTGPWDYLAEVPLVFYGPGVVPPRSIEEPATLADLAPTTASLIGFDGFSAPDGKTHGLSAQRSPKLVVTIVWDGAGWNTLEEHPDRWPFLQRAIRRGVSFKSAEIGSTPSNTAPIHTTMGTGAFPKTHGIPHVKIRLPGGGYVDPYEGNKASLVRVPTLGDVYDREVGNAAKVGVVATVNWHLGMIGHGAEYEGGDRDTAVLLNDQGIGYGNPDLYGLTGYPDPAGLVAATDALDASDGERNGRWDGNDLDDPATRYATPAFTEYQQAVLERAILEEGFGADDIPDLMYVNFKQIDDAGHRWGMTSTQVGDSIKAADDAFKRLTSVLDDSVGKGEWVVVVTADHGQTPYPEESGAWPIRGSELKDDIERAFEEDDIKVLRVTSAGIFLTDPDALENGKAQKVSEWLIDYTVADNVPDGEQLPKEWTDAGDTRLFSAVLAGREVVASSCE